MFKIGYFARSGMLRLAQVEPETTMQAMQARLIRVQQRLSQLESEGKMKEQEIYF